MLCLPYPTFAAVGNLVRTGTRVECANVRWVLRSIFLEDGQQSEHVKVNCFDDFIAAT